MAWIRLATLITIFVTSCIGLGFLAECWIRRHKWRGWVTGLMSVVVALVWPVFVVVYSMYDARQYLLQHPGDDAPGMFFVSLIYVGVPFLFFFGLPLALCGVAFARRRHSKWRELP
jgi:heme/copper-type cytochrome/quinol oxidase subunit 2